MIDDVLRRLEDLEVRYAFQEDTLRQLDEVVQAQVARIEALEREILELRADQATPERADAPPEEQVPPHY